MGLSNKTFLSVLSVVVVLAGIVGYLAWDNLFRREAPHFEDIRELMKYGSVGQEVAAGMPFKIWRVLPTVFADKLPEGADPQAGYAAFGFVYEEGMDIPIGITKSRVGFDRISLSCAACHNSHYRETHDSEPVYYLSGTNVSFYGQDYINFLFASANDERFSRDGLIPAMEQAGELDFIEKLLYSHLIIPRMKEELQQMEQRFDWWYEVPEAGPGRWIAFNDLKFHFAKQPRDGSIGNPDVPTMFNLQVRENIKTYHWDGFTDSLDKAMQNAAVGAGATEETILREDLNRLRDWWLGQPVPSYPFPIDATLAAAGKEVWSATCAECHEIGRESAGRIIPIDEIGTDPHRWALITEGTVEGYNRTSKENYGWPQEWFIRNTVGYTAVLLDAVWLRAPYLHNGSVPTITDLLEPPEARPPAFYRGYDVYDPKRLGYVSSGPEAEREFRYDTSLPGNSNGGHLYGTDLPPEEKTALIEYLKTL
ncbi:MAG: cytochrome c [Pseudomonadota bacterium]